MKGFDLFKIFVEKSIGKPLESLPALPLPGWQAVEALWCFNDRFRPMIEQIRSLPYDRSFEREADAAIAALAHDSDWHDVSSGAWRVLLERQQQAIVLALANEKARNPVMPIPPGLSEAQRSVAVALFLMYGMRLPWPPEDRQGLQMASGSAKSVLRLH